MLDVDLNSDDDLARDLAARVRAHRLLWGWTQVEIAARSGMSAASYKRFERTGEIAFKSLLRIAVALAQTGPLAAWFALPAFRSLDKAIAQPKVRQRAPRRRTP